MAGAGSGFWTEIARRWSLIGPPLRPSPGDVERMASCLPLARRRLRRVLVLGATPEYPALAERVGARATAVDLSGDMLHAIWPRAGASVRGNWLSLPLASDAVDAVIGDGVLTLLGFSEDNARLAAEVRRVLRPGGVFGVRVFCDGHRGEGPEAVHALLRAGGVGNFHELRFRFLMSLQQDAHQGVAVRSLWEYWQHSQPDLSQHFGRPGWEPAAKALIDNYEHAKDRFRFPTADEVRAVLGKEFREIALMGGGHGFDALWPTFAWRREH